MEIPPVPAHVSSWETRSSDALRHTFHSRVRRAGCTRVSRRDGTRDERHARRCSRRPDRTGSLGGFHRLRKTAERCFAITRVQFIFSHVIILNHRLVYLLHGGEGRAEVRARERAALLQEHLHL